MKREIDLKFYGLIGNEEEIHLEIYEILGKCLTHIASAKKNRQQGWHSGPFGK